MARPEVTGRIADASDDTDAFSIGQFCKRHGFSVQLFYKNKAEMPPTFRIGTRVLISKESAAAWRKQRDAAAT